jgi:hypothetical protein
MLCVFGCEVYAYDHTHKKKMGPYATKLRHIGVAADAKGWLLWNPESGKLSTAISVQFNEDKPHVSQPQQIESQPDESIVLAIECFRLGNFTLGDELDAQDALVEALEARDTYSNDSPTYAEAMNLPMADKWEAAMGEERKSLEDMDVWVEDVPPSDRRKIM